MKRFLIGSVLAALLLFGCRAKPENSTEKPAESSVWTVNTSIITDILKEEDKTVFGKAAQGSDAYSPVAVLARQIVSGTNAAYLCLKNAEDGAVWEIVKVYAALDGSTSITQESVIDPAAIRTTDSGIKGGLAGGWEISLDRANAIVLEADVNTAFKNAVEACSEAVLSPVVLLAESDHAYLILAQGTRVEDSSEQIYAVTVPKESEEPAQAEILDLVGYLSE